MLSILSSNDICVKKCVAKQRASVYVNIAVRGATASLSIISENWMNSYYCSSSGRFKMLENLGSSINDLYSLTFLSNRLHLTNPSSLP